METQTTPADTRTVEFPSNRLPMLLARVVELAEIAERLGVEPIRFVETDRFERRDDLGIEWTWVRGDLVGMTPRLPGGWTVLAAIEHMEAGNLVTTFGDRSAEQYRHAAPDCDHCGHNRNRRYTVVVADEDGTVVQVGKSCLKDFVGHSNPENVLWAFESFDEDLDSFGERISRDDSIDVEDLLTLGNAAVRIHGWVPKSATYQASTYDIVMDILFPPKNPDHTSVDSEIIGRVRDAARSNDHQDREQAREAIEWTRALPADSGDYLGNLRAVVSQDHVQPRHWGLALSALSAYAKAMDREVARSREIDARSKSEFVGTVGKREDFVVDVIRIRAFEGQYGTKYLVTMADEDGNILKTFSSGTFGVEAEVGDHMLIRGTVKDHEIYNDANETLLARVTCLNHIEGE